MKRLQASDNRRTILSDGFWKRVDELAVHSILPYQWKALNDEIPGAEKSHCMENLRRAAGKAEGLSGAYQGMIFQDSDLAKWLEAAAYSLERHPNEGLEHCMDEAIALLGDAQTKDGYLNTYYICTDISKRWTNLMEAHELYCAGHLMEAAVAYYEATGKKSLLDIALRMARHIAAVFGPKPDQKKGYPGHPEIELALMRMYRATGERFLFDLAQYFVDQRGMPPDYFSWEQEQYHSHTLHTDPSQLKPTYDQRHAPVRKQQDMEGHSVRALYLLCGMIDVAAESGDQELMEASKRLFHSAVGRRMYVTGGVGSTVHGEAFTLDYDLPNHSAYAETCASVALFFAAHRLWLADPHGCYGDVMERALYNNCMAGMGLDGTRFFYVNPLEVDPGKCAGNPDLAHVLPERPKWFGCACCPPNLARLIASLGRYIYGVDGKGVFVNLYVASATELAMGNERIRLAINTAYPADGQIKLTVSQGNYGLYLRLPEWAAAYTLRVNGKEARPIQAKGMLCLEGPWKDGDVVELVLDMRSRRVYANPKVSADAGRIALQRGPLVYCAEEADNGKALHNLRLPRSARLQTENRDDLFSGAVGILCTGERCCEDWEELYRLDAPARYEPCAIRFIPYHLWANRGLGEMAVWIRESERSDGNE